MLARYTALILNCWWLVSLLHGLSRWDVLDVTVVVVQSTVRTPLEETIFNAEPCKKWSDSKL